MKVVAAILGVVVGYYGAEYLTERRERQSEREQKRVLREAFRPNRQQRTP